MPSVTEGPTSLRSRERRRSGGRCSCVPKKF